MGRIKMFKPKKPKPIERYIMSLNLRLEIYQEITKQARQARVTKQELVRQMINYCLKERGK